MFRSALCAVLAACAFLGPRCTANAQDLPQTRSMVAIGPSADGDLKRLREAILRNPDILDVSLRPISSGVLVRITGEFQPQELMLSLRSIGFDLMPPPTRSYMVSGPKDEAGLRRLTTALEAVPDADQVMLSAQADPVTVRVRGEASGLALLAAAKTAGFELTGMGSYAARVTVQPAALPKLREAVLRLPGVRQITLREVVGGATLDVRGMVDDDQLIGAAKGAGYEIRPLAAAGPNRAALAGAQPSGAAAPSGERNSPPGVGERAPEDLTKVGGVAPDFELLMKDGKSRVRLSDFRGKQPVILIFGSYT